MMKKMKKLIAAGLAASTVFTMAAPAVPAMAADTGEKAITKYNKVLSQNLYFWSSFDERANRTKYYNSNFPLDFGRIEPVNPLKSRL